VVRRVVFAVPGDLDSPTGGYAYDKRIIEELRTLGWEVAVSDLGSSFPRPDATARQAANGMLAKLDPAIPVVIDGLAYGVLPEAGAALGKSHRLIALVHHPLAFESGLPESDAKRFRDSERAALRHVRHVIVTSPATARLLVSDYDVAMERITVAKPGNDPAPPSRGGGEGPLHLLAVGSIVPRKGYDLLVAALSGLKDLSWRLSIVGDPSRDPACAAALDRDIARFDLHSRIERLGAVSQRTLAVLYDRADLFVLPSRFEGYGMAFADAIASGVPVIAARSGAIPETVPAQASILVPPDDVAALASVLRRLIENKAEREALRAQARASARALPSWRESSRAQSECWHERVFGGLAGFARALRSCRAQRARSRRCEIGIRGSRFAVGGRSRLRHRFDLARAHQASARAAGMAARRQRPRLVVARRTDIHVRSESDDRSDRSCPRS